MFFKLKKKKEKVEAVEATPACEVNRGNPDSP